MWSPGRDYGAVWGPRCLGLSPHLPGPQTHLLSWSLKEDLQCQLSGLGTAREASPAAHFHGREGSFSPSPPPRLWPSSSLAPLLPSRVRLCSVDLRQTPPTPRSFRSSSSSSGGKAQELPAAMSAFNLVILGLLTSVPPASCQQGRTGQGAAWWPQRGEGWAGHW